MIGPEYFVFEVSPGPLEKCEVTIAVTDKDPLMPAAVYISSSAIEPSSTDSEFSSTAQNVQSVTIPSIREFTTFHMAIVPTGSSVNAAALVFEVSLSQTCS